jgi:hypothetical protein
MKRNVKLIEERVQRVVERLTALREERDRLRDESESLKVKLDALEAEQTRGQEAPEGTAGIAEIAGVLQEAIRELRGE